MHKKDWFSPFLIALRETQHGGLADDLSGNTGGNHLISLVLMCGVLIYLFFVPLLKKQCRVFTVLILL